jgi:hypothetical protein
LGLNEADKTKSCSVLIYGHKKKRIEAQNVGFNPMVIKKWEDIIIYKRWLRKR